jgi:hypothetical protein
MGFDKISTLLAAATAISTQAAAQAACDPAAGLTFICGLPNAEDLVQAPGTPWIVAGGLAEGEHAGGQRRQFPRTMGSARLTADRIAIAPEQWRK